MCLTGIGGDGSRCKALVWRLALIARRALFLSHRYCLNLNGHWKILSRHLVVLIHIFFRLFISLIYRLLQCQLLITDELVMKGCVAPRELD